MNEEIKKASKQGQTDSGTIFTQWPAESLTLLISPVLIRTYYREIDLTELSAIFDCCLYV